MCRICGIIDKSNQTLKQDTIGMRDAMHRGGPDNAGLYIDEENSVSFGHRRLSIIDLNESGNQPMFSDDKNIILVFNGEIYNYLLLKAELKSFGFQFSTTSDTEVIIKSYQKWGVDCFSRFRGMFTIGLYDKQKSELILARDHAGIKPLYFYTDECLYFSSEIRAFNSVNRKWDENPDWKIYFLTYGYLPDNITTLKGIKALNKGTFLIFNTHTLQYTQHCFFDQNFKEEITDPAEAKQLIKNSLDTAVERHLIADAPIGLFLSGGIDSSLLTLIASKYKKELHTLSITFKEDNYSEKKYQELIAKQVNSHHQSFLLDKNTFVQALPDIMNAMDQPSSDGINSYFISKYAKEAGLKAVLSGLGADELFGGYPSFKRTKLLSRLKKFPGFLFTAAGILQKDKYKKLKYLTQKNAMGDYLFNRGYFVPSETARLLDMNEREVSANINQLKMPEFINRISEGNKTSYMETNLYMQGQLLKDTDYMSMWHSIEVRVPFLDFDLMQNVQRISSALKFGNTQSKFLLIDSYADTLPVEIWKRKKQGFTFPFNEWMKENLDQFMEGKQNQTLNKKFQAGELSWSRYWTYLVSQSFKVNDEND